MENIIEKNDRDSSYKKQIKPSNSNRVIIIDQKQANILLFNGFFGINGMISIKDLINENY